MFIETRKARKCLKPRVVFLQEGSRQVYEVLFHSTRRELLPLTQLTSWLHSLLVFPSLTGYSWQHKSFGNSHLKHTKKGKCNNQKTRPLLFTIHISFAVVSCLWSVFWLKKQNNIAVCTYQRLHPVPSLPSPALVQSLLVEWNCTWHGITYWSIFHFSSSFLNTATLGFRHFLAFLVSINITLIY